jgi:hypothetical protein
VRSVRVFPTKLQYSAPARAGAVDRSIKGAITESRSTSQAAQRRMKLSDALGKLK